MLSFPALAGRHILQENHRMEFLYLFFYRAISGAQNGLGYADSKYRPLATLAMSLMAMAFMLYVGYRGTGILRPLAGLCAVVAFFSAVMVGQSFANRGKSEWYDIHLWETVTTGAITLAVILAGGNLLYVAASVYPALVLHKGFVNLGAGLMWWDSRTDDPTGDTFSIPLLGISIPRASTTIRTVLAALSLLLAILTFAFGWSITIFPFQISL